MRIARLSLLIFSIIIHFFIVNTYVFKTLNHYTYDYLTVFYVLLLISGIMFFLKKTIFMDAVFCVITPYISSVINFFYVSIKTSPHVVINDLWSSIIIGSLLPYIALYAWFLSAVLIVERLGIYCLCKFIKNY